MKRLNKILSLIIAASGTLIVYFLLAKNPSLSELKQNNFYYKDGLFFENNSEELFTGRIIDTAEVIIDFEVSNGKRNGRFTTYFLEGGIEKEGVMIDDKNEGKWNYYYENGQVETTGHFSENLPDGEWISYHINGEIRVKGNFREGLQTGYWYYYNQNGELINTIVFIDDVIKEKIRMSI